MIATNVKTITIFGNGLAGLLCSAKLVRILPDEIKLTYVEASASNKTDIFFGTTTSPSFYEFLLGLDITEPFLLQNTNTSFSLGTQYKNWGPKHANWTQSFNRPLPVFNGVNFHHYLTRLKPTTLDLSDISSFVMAAKAAQKGVFAHPPNGQKIPLADLEYGYHISPISSRESIKSHLKKTPMSWVTADIDSVEKENDSILSVALSNGQSITSDFIINALGKGSKLTASAGEFAASNRTLSAISSLDQTKPMQNVCRTLTGKNYGWQSETPLQNGQHRLTVFDPASEDEAIKDHGVTSNSAVTINLGRALKPWVGNCLTLGHGAAIVEPLTPAPIMLLERDIDRLAELLPQTTKMNIESREYNRRFQSDYEHAELFSKGFFSPDEVLNSPYWIAANETPHSDKLTHKIKQFRSRGVHVQYDYEPFTALDWTLLHLGMGRHPERYDPLAEQVPTEQLKQQLTQMKMAIDTMASKMPPHSVYMNGLLKYLKEKHG